MHTYVGRLFPVQRNAGAPSGPPLHVFKKHVQLRLSSGTHIVSLQLLSGTFKIYVSPHEFVRDRRIRHSVFVPDGICFGTGKTPTIPIIWKLLFPFGIEI